MEVQLLSGEAVTVRSVKVDELGQPETTYNFEVAHQHNYYVGQNGVLVHNGRGGWGSTLPSKGGPPNGSLVNGGLDQNGNAAGTIRDYDANGNAKTDYDFGHNHPNNNYPNGPGDPHAHDWNNGTRDPNGRPIGPCD